MSDKSSLSRENLKRHTQNQFATGELTQDQQNHINQQLQNVRLLDLFFNTELQLDPSGSSSSSISDQNCKPKERGRRMSIEKNPRARYLRNSERSADANRRLRRFINGIPTAEDRTDYGDISSQSSFGSREERIDTSMLNNVRVTGRDENGISRIFDPDNTSILLAASTQQTTPFPIVEHGVRRADTDSPILRAPSCNINDWSSKMYNQNSDNEDGSKLFIELGENRNRNLTNVGMSEPVVLGQKSPSPRSSLKRTSSAGPKIPSGRVFKTPRIQRDGSSSNAPESDAPHSFDLKFPKIGRQS